MVVNSSLKKWMNLLAKEKIELKSWNPIECDDDDDDVDLE